MMKTVKIAASVACWVSLLAVPMVVGCGEKAPPAPAAPKTDVPSAPSAAPASAAAAAAGGAKRAVAKITTTSDGGITGSASFTANGKDVEVALELQNAPPGLHAWHIHDGTSCGREKQADGGMGGPGTAAGPHWNPGKMNHGLPTAKAHHAGDFGNFTADSSGKASAKLTTDAFNLDGTGDLSAIGHAVIIHGGTDDGQGANGDAGARVGCGIIEKQ